MNKKFILAVALTLFIVGCTDNGGIQFPGINPDQGNGYVPGDFPDSVKFAMPTFDSCSAISESFASIKDYYSDVFYEAIPLSAVRTTAAADGSVDSVAPAGSSESGTSPDYSGTNVQVEGVDEADFVKTDGKYLYIISKGHLIIAKAFPSDQAEILAKINLKEFNPSEMFIQDNTLLLFGSKYYSVPQPEPVPLESEPSIRTIAPDEYYPEYYGSNFSEVQLWDISDHSNPNRKRVIGFEGSYLTARKIGDYAYFVIQSSPSYQILRTIDENPNDVDDRLLPNFYDATSIPEETLPEFTKIAGCGDIGYLPPIQSKRFVTVAAVSMKDLDAVVERETVVASGENVYASLNNLYLAEVNYEYAEIPVISDYIGPVDSRETTVIHKFGLTSGTVTYKGFGEAPGHILNQFSMDEHENHFRIATTIGDLWDTETPSTNNLYIFDDSMKLVGSIEDLAPGEKIYSTRFMGDQGYMVTFKKVDPLFVFDLSDPTNPKVLGKLKIPGYSDYLHPFSDGYVIGVGKDAVDAGEDLVERRQLDFAWYQGLKLAIFDVTDVSNPKQLHSIVVGDRGTESYALSDHRAFLFDREKELLVIPVQLAEIDQETLDATEPSRRDNTYGDTTFDGAYVYNITLENGFDLQGRITHVDDPDVFLKSGYYYWSNGNDVKRSLYIENVLYTVSNNKILLNNLSDLSLVKKLVMFETDEIEYDPFYDE